MNDAIAQVSVVSLLLPPLTLLHIVPLSTQHLTYGGCRFLRQLMRLILCMQVRDKMETAKRDTVYRVDKYTKKYKPTADKYNKLCVSQLWPSSRCIRLFVAFLQVQIRAPQTYLCSRSCF